MPKPLITPRIRTSAFQPHCLLLGGTGPCTPSSNSGCFIDTVLSNGTKSGYSFAVQVGSIPAAGGLNLSYSAIATPLVLDITGTRYFCSFEDFVLRSSSANIAPPCTSTNGALQSSGQFGDSNSFRKQSQATFPIRLEIRNQVTKVLRGSVQRVLSSCSPRIIVAFYADEIRRLSGGVALTCERVWHRAGIVLIYPKT